MSKYLGSQCDGKHYTDMKLQPVQLAEMLGATPEFCKVSKYLTRDKNDKFINIDKAEHCLGLEEELGVKFWKYPYNVLVGLKWKYFKSSYTVHDLIVDFVGQQKGAVFIQGALHKMLIKDYDAARVYIQKYRELMKKVVDNEI